MLVACWWSLDVGGVGSGGARERDSDGGCCRGSAGAGESKREGIRSETQLWIHTAIWSGELLLLGGDRGMSADIFTTFDNIFYQTSLDAAVRRLTVKSLIAEEFKFLSRIHLDDLSEWIFSKSECKV